MLDQKPSASIQMIVAVASIVIIIAGIKAAAEIVSPFVLSIFIAIISSPPLFWLEKHKVPRALAMLIIISGIVFAGIALFSLIGNSAEAFTQNIPAYSVKLQSQLSGLTAWLGEHGIKLNIDLLLQYFDPSSILTLVANTLSGFGAVLTNGFLILLTVIFILFEASSFPRKLKGMSAEPDKALRHYRRITRTVEHYIALKTIISLLTGAIIAIWLSVLGVDFPLLWGVLAFLLNFVPNIGSVIAAVPPSMLALVQLGPSYALLTAAGFLAVNTVIGNIIEPRFMGRGLGLSSLVVFLSLVFWGWGLGPVGMLLSVPLTMTVKIFLESNDNTRWIAILLGSDDELPQNPKAQATPVSNTK